MESSSPNGSILLWAAACLVAFLGARAFVEYFRRANYEGPIVCWRDVLLGSAALTLGAFGSMSVAITSHGLQFTVGYHPLRLFGAAAAGFVLLAVVLVWVTFRPGIFGRLGASVVGALVLLLIQVGVLVSLGAEPGFLWQPLGMGLAAGVSILGVIAAGWMVVSPVRGSKQDRRSRRLLAALLLGAAIAAAQELVIVASGLEAQQASSYTHLLPQIAVALLGGGAIPMMLVLMLIDQRAQQRVRASERRRKRRVQTEYSGNESMFFTDSKVEAALAKMPRPTQPMDTANGG